MFLHFRLAPRRLAWIALISLAWTQLLATSPAQEAVLRISPTELARDQRNILSLDLSSIPAGVTVWFERYADLDGNGILDSTDLFVDRFQVTDGQLAELGGIPSPVIPGDEDGLADGHIQSQVSFNAHPADQVAPAFLFRAVNISNTFHATQGYSLVPNAWTQSIQGQATVDGEPVPAAWIFAFEPFKNGRLISSALSDSNGHYRLELPVGAYQLAASQTGFVFNMNTQPTVALSTNNQAERNLNLVRANSSFSGQVQDADSATGIAPGLIRLESADGHVSLGFTDSEGKFALPVLAGRWRLGLEEPALVRSGYLVPKFTNYYEVPSGGLAQVVVPVPKATAMVMGSVQDNFNRNVADLRIVARKQGQPYQAVGGSDPFGQFVLSLNQGTWEIEPELSSLADRGLMASEPIVINIANGVAESIAINLQRASFRFQGKTLNLDNQPVASALLVSSEPSSWRSPSHSNLDGQFTVAATDGDWHLTLDPAFASINGLVQYHLPFSVTNGAGPSNLVYYVAPLQARIQGRIENGDGAALTNQPVMLQHSSGMTMVDATDEQGNYDVGVSGGTWILSLPALPSALSLAPSVLLDVKPGTNLDHINLQVKTSNRGIAGQVLDSASNGIAHVTVLAEIQVSGTNYTSRATTDEMGLFLVKAFEGTWQVSLVTNELAALGWIAPEPQQVDLANDNALIQFVLQRATPPQPAQLTFPSRGQEDQIQFYITGTSNVLYTVQASTDLRQWADLQQFKSDGEPFLFRDGPFSASVRRFYRVVVKP